MAVVEITTPGSPGVLQLARRPVPRSGAGEVLVKVAAAGVNRADLMQRRGQYPPPPGVSDVLGLELSGEIVALGPEARRWRIGDRVCALVAGGGYAEFCVVPDALCLPVPAGVSLVDAAALPEALFTVWTNVFDRGALHAGEALLVHGGSSGIGTAAIALTRAFGARVFATAGTPEKCAACERLGAERAIDYRTEDFVPIVREATGGRGVDVILDMVGAAYLPRNIEALADGGRLVLIATMSGSRAEVDLRLLMSRRLVLTGSTLRPRSVAEKAAIARALEERVWPLLEARTVAPVIHARFPLAQAAEAHRVMEASTHIGKLLLVV